MGLSGPGLEGGRSHGKYEQVLFGGQADVDHKVVPSLDIGHGGRGKVLEFVDDCNSNGESGVYQIGDRPGGRYPGNEIRPGGRADCAGSIFCRYPELRPSHQSAPQPAVLCFAQMDVDSAFGQAWWEVCIPTYDVIDHLCEIFLRK